MAGICAFSGGVITGVERVLPRNLFPPIKSNCDLTITEEFLHMYFADPIVGETAWDGKSGSNPELSATESLGLLLHRNTLVRDDVRSRRNQYLASKLRFFG